MKKSAKLSAFVFMFHFLLIRVRRVAALSVYFVAGVGVMFGSLALAVAMFSSAWGLLFWFAVSVPYGAFVCPLLAEYIDNISHYRNTIIRFYW